MEPVRLDTLDPVGWGAPAVTVGNFDGVHRGHQALVARVVAEARAAVTPSVVLTFDPHPSRVLSQGRAPSSLMTLAQKAEILERLGIDRLAVIPFSVALSKEPAEEFARLVLRRALGAQVVVVGSNFRFGRDRAGDLPALEGFGTRLSFRVVGVDPVIHEGAPISSTRIREALARGAVEAARALLGRSFSIVGRVVEGAGRGRTLGVPTANLDVANETVPGRGVYAGWCLTEAGGPPWPAVVNVGHRPTFGGSVTVVEAHLLGFSGNLYGRSVSLAFEERLREEQTFSGPDALKEQIERDVARARAVLVKA